MATVLGQLETQFFAYIQERNRASVETGELTRALGLIPTQERKLLSRLSRSGLITRVRRGLYLVPPHLPAGGRWSPGEFLVLQTLIAEKNGIYQICGPNAFYRYAWIDQIPNRIYAYNNRISGERTIGAVTLTLIKVATQRLGATEIVKTPEGIAIVYSSKPRALMDAVYDWARFNTLPQAYDWIRVELATDDTLAAQLINVSLRYGNQGTLRRIGKLFETAGVQESLLRKLTRALHPSSSLIPWVPTFPKRGKTDQRWGIVLNDAC
jgi:predicted transcriptional regulator of viral defense system